MQPPITKDRKLGFEHDLPHCEEAVLTTASLWSPWGIFQTVSNSQLFILAFSFLNEVKIKFTESVQILILNGKFVAIILKVWI